MTGGFKILSYMLAVSLQPFEATQLQITPPTSYNTNMTSTDESLLNLPGNGHHQGGASEGSTWLPDKQNRHATVIKGTEYRLGCGCQRCDMRNARIATQILSPIEFTIRLSAFS